jgi:hypothetical protein
MVLNYRSVELVVIAPDLVFVTCQSLRSNGNNAETYGTPLA